MAIIGVIGILVFLIGTIWLAINAIRKKDKKRPLITFIVGLAMAIVGIANTPTSETSTKNTKTSSSTEVIRESSKTKEISSSTSENKKEESSTTESSKEDISDITVLSDEATSSQKDILLSLTQQQFDQQFPYKGSKMHSILGILQDWTQYDGRWYYKVEATVVNAFGAKQDANLEVYVTPQSATSGLVELVAY